MPNDQYGSGRWGTGDRPLGTGPGQSAWDQGAQDRRFEEQRRQQQDRHRQDSARRANEDRQRQQRTGSGNTASHRSSGSDTSANLPGFFHTLWLFVIVIAITSGFVLAYDLIVNLINPTDPEVVKYLGGGKFAAGLVGLGVGFRLRFRLVKISLYAAGIALVGLVIMVVIGMVLEEF